MNISETVASLNAQNATDQELLNKVKEFKIENAAGLSLAPPSSMEMHAVSCCSSTSIPFNSSCNVLYAKDTNATPSLSARNVERKRKIEKTEERTIDQERTDTTIKVQSSTVIVASKHDIELSHYSPLPLGWEQCLDMQTGEMYYFNSSSRTKTREDPRKHREDLSFPIHWPYNLQIWAINGKFPAASSDQLQNAQLDLSLNLSSKKLGLSHNNNKRPADLARKSGNRQSVDIAGATEELQGEDRDNDMVAVPCRNCLMFVMLPKASPQCPRCGTSYRPTDNKIY